jgi:hypothetical protein
VLCLTRKVEWKALKLSDYETIQKSKRLGDPCWMKSCEKNHMFVVGVKNAQSSE